MTTVTWVKDVNDYYEVSSPEHLIQAMNYGTKYTNAGDTPISFNSSTTKYLQTVDIDLADFHEHIVPFSGTWSGTYDGGNHSIANWEYHNDSSPSGFFTVLSGKFMNVKLTGVWKLGGISTYKGFIAGTLQDNGGRIDNVTTFFEAGTEITGTGTEVGGLVGRLQNGAYISGCTLNGILNLSDTGYACGGFVGQSQTGNMTYCANYATFPNGIKCSGRCGGIVGNMYNSWTEFHNIINGMTGDIGDQRSNPAGGIAGGLSNNANTVTVTEAHTLVNVMIGDISTLTVHSGTSGGIAGITSGIGTCTMSKFVNYMTGNIVGNSTGGLIGKIDNKTSSTVSFSNSIVAMNGNVQHDAVVNSILHTANTASAVVNTDFGMTFSTNNFSTTDALVDFVTDDVFTLLPYLPMSGTSQEGASISFDASFGNLSGLDPISPFAIYSTLTIHTSPEIFYPSYVSMGFSDTNTTKYLTYGTIQPHKITLYVDDAITGPVTSTADSVFNMSGTLLKGLTWVQNVSNEFEVSSHAHLIQIMSKGTVYDDFDGSIPADYMASNFIQTTDIDLDSKESVIEPIGTAAQPFTGIYSGEEFSISNWKYDRGTPDDGTGVEIGLFGRVDGGSIGGINLEGTWSMSGSCSVHGLLVGSLTGTSALVANVNTHFEAGTSITSGHATSSTCGLLIGSASGDCTISGIKASGELSYQGSDTILGGIVGSISSAISISWIFNNLNLVDGLGALNTITTATTGGIIGSVGVGVLNAFHLTNSCQGAVVGGVCGGVIGSFATGTMTRSDTWVNAMKGGIVGSACAGGIIGEFEALSVDVSAITKVTNYMSGDIASTASGGIIGRTVDSSSGSAPAIECTNSVNAMNGTVGDTAIGQVGHTVSLAIKVNEDFGLVFSTNVYATTDALSGYETFTGFPLPFLSMSGTEIGLTHDIPIVFPNVSGVDNTSPLFGYDTVIIHSSSTLNIPFQVEFDFTPDGTRYIAYAKSGSSELYVDPSMTIVSSTATYNMDYDGNSKLGFLPPILNNQTAFDNTGTSNRRHSWTHYTDEFAIGALDGNSTGAFNTVTISGASGSSNFSLYAVRVLGCVYNQAEKVVYFVFPNNNRIAKKGIDASVPFTYIFQDATYHTICGDDSNTYMFGSRLASGVQQIYRMDTDGTNMITVDNSALFGTNTEVNHFTSNRDDKRIYFSDQSTGRVVYSLSWDLDDLQTMPFELRGANRNSIFYHQGLIYFGNRDPLTKAVNDSFYAYDIAKNGYRLLEGRTLNMEGTKGRNHVYVHPGTNRLLVSSKTGTGSHIGINFDFHTDYIFRGKKYNDGYDFSWVPIEGATSYQVDVNGVVATTTETTYTTRGHADGASLQIQLAYSTDDVTYVDYRYGYTSFTVEAKFSEVFTPPGYSSPWNASMTWLNPYEPDAFIYSIGSGLVVYNISTQVSTSYNVPNITMLGRSFTTRSIIGLANDRFYDFGVNGNNLLDMTVPPLPDPFYIHPSPIQYMHCSFTGLIYFTVKTSNEVWSVNLDGTGATLLFTLNSTASSLATDPYNASTLVYADGTDLMYRNLSTGDSRIVFAGAKMALNNGIVVMDDVIYTVYRWQNEGYLHVNIDGVTDLSTESRSWGVGILVDTVNQLVYDFTIGSFTVYTDGTFAIASLPQDPSSMIVSVTPLGMRASWSAIAGATSYNLSISEGNDGDNVLTLLYKTSNTSELFYQKLLPSSSTYTVYLKYDTSTETNVLSALRTITIPGASTDPVNFSKDFFVGKEGRFDLTKVKIDLGNVLNSLFETGDSLDMSIPGGKRVTTKFVKRGETVPISEQSTSISIPFSKDAGSGQSISIALSDTSTVDVDYDEVSESLTVQGVSYVVGEYFVLDGKKVFLYDV